MRLPCLKEGGRPAEGSDRVEGPLLDVRSVSLRFDGVQALDSVTFSIPERARCGLIGPNGAGKTTLFNCISRLFEIQSGDIRFAGRDIGRMAPHAVHALGVARTFQSVGLIPGMTVLENVMTGAGRNGRHGFFRSAITLAELSELDANVRRRAFETLERIDLGDAAHLTPPELPFGTQKRVELARALISDPRLLMLDEPANGLTATEVNGLRDLLLRIWRESETTLLIVEHHMGFVMSICEDIVVLDAGRLLARGAPDQIRNNPDVIQAYLGRRARDGAP
jgi:branched-chain amino acid transport system ATP-binding protein